MITETTRALLGAHRDFVDDIGGISMANFWPVVREAIEATEGPVVEIGADLGHATRLAAELCAAAGREFHSVDPFPADGSEIVGARRHALTSQRFLEGTPPRGGTWIVDGDHNYDTVSMELAAISGLVGASGAAPVIVLHDLGWPSGRRDQWYGEPPSGAADAGEGVSLDNPGLAGRGKGLGLGSIRAVAPVEGGARNGVMTAVEDFVASNPDWELRWCPSFFGFGVLATRGFWADPRATGLVRWFDAAAALRPVMGAAEANRLRLLQTVNEKWVESQRLWEALQDSGRRARRCPWTRLKGFARRIGGRG